jgi:hypothetical protein
MPTTPDWFILDNYKRAQELTIEDWAAAIRTRYSISEGLKGKMGFTSNSNEISVDQFIKETLPVISKWPYHLSKSSMLKAQFNDNKYFAVTELTLGHLDCIRNDIIYSELAADGKLEVGERGYKNHGLPVHDFLDLASNPQAYFQVDFTVTEEALVRDFKRIIQQLKLNSPFEKRERFFTDGDFMRWTKNHCLAYFDLTSFYELNKIKSTHHSIGSLLALEYSDVSPSDRVRRTIKPMTDRLISIHTMDILGDQLGSWTY